MLVENQAQGAFLAKTSLANLVRLCEPVVILDEGHKATSALARQTIEGFNPALVVELSATPAQSANILVSVGGMELLQEEMIKLPINVACSNLKSWKDCLTQARDQRLRLAKLARDHYQETGRIIRPIVLVQVERTGKNQRDTDFVHAEQVKEFLMQNLSVPETAIAIKSSEKDDIEIEGIDLLDEGCPKEWIITKAALQEGWDCPFAYILVSLNNTARAQTMTQLVGRVLRQPNVTRTAHAELNESYVYCLRKKAADITREVKKALEKEGYEGEAASVVDRSSEAARPAKRAAVIRPMFREHYRKPFAGKIYLPRFCVKNGKREPEKLDYFRHLIGQVDVDRFRYEKVDWDLAVDLAAAKDNFYRITLGQEEMDRVGDKAVDILETDDQIKTWWLANLPFDYLSHKQLRKIIEAVADRLFQVNPELPGKLALVKFVVREKMVGFIEREVDFQTEEAFKKLHTTKKLCFFLECLECRFEIPETIEVRPTRQLSHANGDLPGKSLYDYIPEDDLNQYEQSVALYLDEHPQVLWWYRNLVGPNNFSIQGFRRHPLYPDFVVQKGKKKPVPTVLVLDSKGQHLKGSEDTNYKRSVADYFEKVGHKVPWQQLAEEFADHTFRFQILDEGDYTDRDWKDDLRRLLEETS